MTSAAEPVPTHVERGSGKPLVLVPGMEGAKEFWRFQMDELARRYRVIAMSLVVRRARLASEVGNYADDVVRLMDALGLDTAALVGQSFGGLVVQEVALRHPDRVAALVLANTLDRPRPVSFGLDWFTLATAAQPLVFLLPRWARRPYLSWVGSHHGFVMDATPGNADLADYVIAHGLAQGLEAYVDRAIAAAKARTTERLGAIRAPTLIVRGTCDRIVSQEAVSELAAGIPRSEVALVAGGGHCCPHTMPTTTNRAILEWLERVKY